MSRIETNNFTPSEGLEHILFDAKASSAELPNVDEDRSSEISPEFQLLIGELSPEEYSWTLSPGERDLSPHDDF